MKRILLFFMLFLSLTAGAQDRNATRENAKKLQIALFAIENLYVDKTDESKLVEDAIIGMLDKLDPHSTYTDPE